MIVLDLDGTILDCNKKISIAAKEYLMNLKRKGYIIVIATGRIYISALEATDGAEFANYIISDTGSCIYDVSTGKTIFCSYIDSTIAEKVLGYYNKENYCYIDVCSRNKIYKYSDKIVENPIVENSKDIAYILNNCKNISHISITMKNNDLIMKVYHDLIHQLSDIEVIIMQDSFANKKWLEIMPKGSSKYNRIRDLSNYLGIHNEEIISFVDGLNDIEMLEKCGTGVALLNALKEVKLKADDITKLDYNNDGVINYLKKFLYDETTSE